MKEIISAAGNANQTPLVPKARGRMISIARRKTKFLSVVRMLATFGLPRTLAMNLPLPSGSSPAENPPESMSIWQVRIPAAISSIESKTSLSDRLRNTVMRTSAPALRKALAES